MREFGDLHDYKDTEAAVEQMEAVDPQLAQNEPQEGKLPFVSVIMPVRNEAAFIRRSLASVLRQSYPPHLMEVIIADGSSTDCTREEIRQLASATDIAVWVVDNPRRIAPSGLNCAIEKARGEIVIRVDGHCEIASDYVEHCVRHLRNRDADGVGGPIETVGETLQAEAIAAAMSSKFGVGGSEFRCVKDRSAYVDTVAFPAYDRRVFEKIGLFNEELVRNQDDEFNFRLRKNGGRILLSQYVKSRYYSRSNFASLWRQYYQYGLWKVRVMQLHPRQMSLRHFIPMGFVLAVIGLSVLCVFSSAAAWALAGLLAFYLVSCVGAAIKVAADTKFALFPAVLISFIILHFSYGFGFLAGLLRFRNHWRRPLQAPALSSRP